MSSGLLLIDKLKGWTSHDVVAKLRGVTGIRQIGHAGTLDPLATGLLVLLVGAEATKRQAEFTKLEKSYEAVIRLGTRSSTDDAEGPIEPTQGVTPPERSVVEHELEKFRGTFEQHPPAFSAKKVGGVRLYQAARKGKPINTTPTQVTVYDLQLLRYEYPDVTLRIRCSSGTYIRSIARDLGETLGIGGYLAELRRIAVGLFTLKQAVQIENLTPTNWQTFLSSLDVTGMGM